ncbi:SAM-dependent methyltransferase [Mycobacterium sp. MAA66]|uniref:class I SAM-dependent methyltransferase n=1 Tax=Mycobacterium sp. MAA66 TaxID=3156297 RepID=UPI003514FBB0
MSEVMDWDRAYQGELFLGPPPWNIGAPQPEILTLIDAGKIHSPVLDAGCGVGDVALALGEHGFDVVGVDISGIAIEAATAAAAERGLTAVRFLQGDVRRLNELGLTEQFQTIIDCTLFHSLPVDARDDYLRGAHDLAATGATLYLLVFTTEALPPDSPFPIPNLVTEAEVSAAVAKHWTNVTLQPAVVAVKPPEFPGQPERNFPTDDLGLARLPALLLTARKA